MVSASITPSVVLTTAKKRFWYFRRIPLNISIVFLRILSLRCGARFWYRRPV